MESIIYMERQDRQNSHLYYVFTTERSSERCNQNVRLVNVPKNVPANRVMNVPRNVH